MTEYAERDPKELDEGGHYCKHLMAMTAEDLHSKRDIACELAYRDKRIAELEAALQELTDLMEDTITGEYTPDSFTTQPARAALAIRKEIDT